MDGLMFRLFCIDTAVASRQPGNHLLYPFSRKFTRQPWTVKGLLTPEEENFFLYLCQQMVQLRKYENVDLLRDYAMMTDAPREALIAVLRDLPPDIVRSAFPPEELLKGLDPEERLKGLDPGEVIRHYDPDALVKALDPETRARLKRLL
jgi:hypothetical protein